MVVYDNRLKLNRPLIACELACAVLSLLAHGTTGGRKRALPFRKDALKMAKCFCCGKGPMSGHNVSKSQRRTNRKWKPNLQRVRAIVGGAPKRIRACTSCIKAGKVKKAARG